MQLRDGLLQRLVGKGEQAVVELACIALPVPFGQRPVVGEAGRARRPGVFCVVARERRGGFRVGLQDFGDPPGIGRARADTVFL